MIPRAAKAPRQPPTNTNGAATKATTTPPPGTPVCLMPMAVARSSRSNHAITPLLEAGFKKLYPRPARKKTGTSPGERWRHSCRHRTETQNHVPLQARFSNAETVRHPTGAEGGAGHRQVKRGKKQTHLRSRESKLLLIEWRQGVDAVLRRR